MASPVIENISSKKYCIEKLSSCETYFNIKMSVVAERV